MEGERETFEAAPLFFALFLPLFRGRRPSDGLCPAAASAASLRSAGACSPSSAAGARAAPPGGAGFGGAVAAGADGIGVC